jgi:hypothetical protein
MESTRIWARKVKLRDTGETSNGVARSTRTSVGSEKVIAS